MLLIWLLGFWIDVSNAATSDDSHITAATDDSQTGTADDSHMATDDSNTASLSTAWTTKFGENQCAKNWSVEGSTR